ncbi:hypothetical protein DNTS_024960 [Danionella cerebrum]|uniref:Uncharacterized protein n=1 Tax=Danionella cerebrum TaxID=2873325 RepID=A0A553MW36_9TELE|nr:hypothetical protein DNTS_024960 [Danionella translucida]
MFRWCQTLCILVAFAACASLPVGHRGALSFANSLRLTRTIRTRVQHLLARYNQQLFGDALFEYRELMLRTLPAVSVSYQRWIQMQDFERLDVALQNLHVFWIHLDSQRQQLEREREATKARREQRRDKRGRPQPDLCQSFEVLQVDLRDLMSQVSYQLSSFTSESGSTISQLVSTSSPSPRPSMQPFSTGTTLLQTTTHTNNPDTSTHFTNHSPQTSSSFSRGPTSVMATVEMQPTTVSPGLLSTPRATSAAATSLWVQHLNGYVILRDLERYLRRLARDYTLLQAKY